MNNQKELEKHLLEATLHLEIISVYLVGFKNYDEKIKIESAIKNLRDVSSVCFLRENSVHFENDEAR